MAYATFVADERDDDRARRRASAKDLGNDPGTPRSAEFWRNVVDYQVDNPKGMGKGNAAEQEARTDQTPTHQPPEKGTVWQSLPPENPPQQQQQQSSSSGGHYGSGGGSQSAWANWNQSSWNQSTLRAHDVGHSGFTGEQLRFWQADSLNNVNGDKGCLLYTSPSPRDQLTSRMPSSA